MGCEIGNHTVTIPSSRKLSDAKVEQELADCVAKIEKLAPGTKVDTIALPMGISPKNKKLLASGSYEGQTYSNRAVLLVGANPAPAPISKRFNPMRLPRIQALRTGQRQHFLARPDQERRDGPLCQRRRPEHDHDPLLPGTRMRQNRT